MRSVLARGLNPGDVNGATAILSPELNSDINIMAREFCEPEEITIFEGETFTSYFFRY